MATDNNKTFLEDRESLEALISLMPEDLRRVYNLYTFRGMESAFPGRKFVVFTLNKGKPDNIEVLTFGAMRMSAEGGPTVEVFSNRRPDPWAFGMIPAKLPGRDVFLHVPQKFEFKWKGKRSARDGVNFAPHYAVLIKSGSNPVSRADDQTYCVRLNQFWEMFPGHEIGY